MRSIGYVLIVVSFLAGAYLAVEQAQGVPLVPFLVSLAVGIVGVAIVRTSIMQAARHEDTMSANIEAIGSSLESVVAKVERLVEDRESIDVYELRHIIDREFPTDLGSFVEARQSIAHRHGLQAYANVMNPFSVGERYLNRVWSTSTDGYIDEAHLSLARSRDEFREALAVFRALQS